MKINFLLAFLLFFLCFSAYGQFGEHAELDPAIQLMEEGKSAEAIELLSKKIEDLDFAKNEELFINAHFLKAKALIHTRRSEEALGIYRSITSLAEKNKLDSIAVISKMASVTIYEFQGNQDSIKTIVESVLEYPNLLAWQKSNCHTYLGGVYGKRNEVEKAIYHHKLAVNIDRELSDSSSMPFSSLNLGSYYSDIDSQEQALQYILEGYEYLRGDRDKFKKANMLDRLGEIYMDLGNYYQAEKYVDETQKLCIELGLRRVRVESITNKVEILQQRGELHEALELLEIADSIANTEWDRVKVKVQKFYIKAEIEGKYNQKELSEILALRESSTDPEVARSVGIVELKTRGINWSEQKFISVYDKFFDETNAKNNVLTKISFLKTKYKYFEKNEKYKDAIEIKKKLEQVIANQTKLNNQYLIADLETEYQTERKKQEIELLNTKNESSAVIISAQRNRIWIVSIALGLISLLSFALWRIYQKTISQKAIISKALNEKDLLLREIHHRVKNNLQLVSSLLTLQGDSIDDDMAQKAIQEGKSRVMSMALIHQDLYNKENLTAISVKEYLDKLTTELFSTYNVNENNIKLYLDIQDIDLDVDTLIPIGLILNELITNSLKYAFNSKQKGIVSIEIGESENLLNVNISDNGNGYDIEKSDKSSFGSVLVSSLVEQLDGDLIINSSEEGTRIKMNFKDYKIVK